MEACNSTEKTFMRDYEMITTLGQGHFAKVKLAIHHDTRTCVAVKILRNTKKRATLIENEISIMKSISHPNILKLLDVVQTQKTTYLLVEVAPLGDLMEHILLRGSLEESEAWRLFAQIVQAVQHCQDHYICHRDITANNVLIDGRGNAKLSDFGLARHIAPGQKLLGFCGTPLYCAPEVFGAEDYDPFPTDIWSVGVLLFLMVAGYFPFEESSFEMLRELIRYGMFTIPQHVSRNIFNVLVNLLVVNPARRPTIDQIMGCLMLRGREAHSLLGTTSPSTGGPLTDKLYEPEEGIQSRGDKAHIEESY
ncbi:sperm motility kinase X-like [Acomys russatus]|uniref:sperm motility kinase X-like n=1 Tax=Acomys russatus TaxID=60746 RepID=UPI0021E1E73A|nr:sperm motility kinase X-like [Acomys russatus]